MADDNQIGSDTLSLAANGHLAFTLGANTYPSTAAISGTIEFDMPAGAFRRRIRSQRYPALVK